jgi:3-hydroxypropanoate dehydrogenase
VTDTAEQVSPPLPRLDACGRASLFTHARTANSFSSVPVSDAELSEIWELAKWGPTSANTQPLRVLYVARGDGRERLARHMHNGNRAKVAAAPAVAVLAWDTQFYDHLSVLLPTRPQLKKALESDEGFRAGTGKFNSALQAGYYIMSVRAHGLAAGPMAGFDADALNADFFPDGRWQAVLVVNIGHPGENPWSERLPRLSHSEVIRWV